MSLSSGVMRKAVRVAVEAAGVAPKVIGTKRVGNLIELVKIEGGAFAMGSGKSACWVGLTDCFMGRTAVTERQWRVLVAAREKMGKARFDEMRRSGIDPTRINPSDPAVCTSWDDAQEFLRRFSETTEAKGSGLRFFLPSEAQQEFSNRGRMIELRQLAQREGADFSTETAVRAFVDSRFENFVVVPPDALPEIGSAILAVDDAIPLIFRGRNQVFASQVFGTQFEGLAAGGARSRFSRRGYEFEPADWGPLNSQGLRGRPFGVFEWGSDWYGDIARSHRPSVDPLGPLTGQLKVMRGCSPRWGATLENMKVSWRYAREPGARDGYTGFRVAAAYRT